MAKGLASTIKSKDLTNSTLPPPVVSKDREDERKMTFININGSTHLKLRIKEIIKYYNSKGYLVDKNGIVLSNEQVDGSKVIPGQKIRKCIEMERL